MFIPLIRHSRLWPEIQVARQEAAPVDIKELPTAYEICLDVPGISHDNIQVELHDRYLMVSSDVDLGTGTGADKEQGRSITWFRRERPSPVAFVRAFGLPEDVKPDKISASLENGVLKVTLPKAASARPPSKTIHVSKL